MIDSQFSTFYQKHTWYTITINPSDDYQYFGKPDRMTKFKNFMYEQFLSWPQFGIHYYFNYELSEPTTNALKSQGIPRLHLHGIIKFNSNKSIKHFLLNELYKISKYSIYEIDTIKDPQLWCNYCQKQQTVINETPLSNFTDSLEVLLQLAPHGA